MVLLTINSVESMVDAMFFPSAGGTGQKGVQSSSPSNVVLTETAVEESDPTEMLGLCEPMCAFKPFFIMDWLDEVEPKALHEAQRILGSKRNQGYLSEQDQHEQESSDPSPVPGLSVLKKKLSEETSTSNRTSSGRFHTHSVAVGNGFNAKGIQKARQGIWNEALSCWESALQVRQQVLGEDHVDVANTHNNIGIALGKLGRFEEAIHHLEKALEIRTAQYGEKHAEVAATLHNTGNVYQQAGDLSSALHCFCECKVIQERIHQGLDHAEVARACIAIGHCYWENESAYDAREAYLDALAIFQRIGRPENDPEVQTTVEDIYELDQRILRETSVVSSSQQ